MRNSKETGIIAKATTLLSKVIPQETSSNEAFQTNATSFCKVTSNKERLCSKVIHNKPANFTRLFALASLAILFLAILPAAYAISEEITLQGKLTNSSGQALSGDYTFIFELFDSNSGGTALWTETHGLTVTNGVFAANLGSNNSTQYLTTSDFNAERWVQITVDGSTQVPRVKLNSQPSAFIAKKAMTLDLNAFMQFSDFNSWYASTFAPTFVGDTNVVNIGVSGGFYGTEIYSSTLTAGRIPYIGTGGLLSDTSKLTYSTTTDGLTMNTGVLSITGPDGAIMADAPDVLTVVGGTGGNVFPKTGGKIVLTAGDGTPTPYSGAGGSIELTTGNSGTGTGTGGNAGDFKVTTGSAGAITSVLAGGNGGDMILLTGTGANSSAGLGGDGGNIELTLGAGGTGSSAGSFGNIMLAKFGGNVAIGLPKPFSTLDVNGDVNVSSTLVVAGDSNFVNTGFSGNIYGDSSTVITADKFQSITGVASGVDAVALGLGTTASGDYSTAMGYDTIASGSMSTALGDSTMASGNYSIAMGGSDEGYCYPGSTASGQSSTALGACTTASGTFSTTIGYNTKAIGQGAIAGGYSTGNKFFAIGNGAIALGYSDANLVAGDAAADKGAIALGYNVQSLAEASVTLGKNLTNYNANSVLMQDLNVLGDFSVVGVTLGADSNFTNIGISNNIYGLGTITGAKFVSTAATSAGGANAIALGTKTTASGISSTAFGFATDGMGGSGDITADGTGSLAGGFSGADNAPTNITAGEDGSVALGFTFGGSILSNGQGSMAVGYSSSLLQAAQKGAISLGYNTKAFGNGAVALGYDTNAVGQGAFAVGDGSIATGNASVTLGKDLTNYNANSVLVQDLNVLGDMAVSGVTLGTDANFVNVGISGTLFGGSPLEIGSDLNIAGATKIRGQPAVGLTENAARVLEQEEV